MTKQVRDRTLREVADKLNFEPHRLRLDQSGRYDETLDHEFPFLIKLFRFCHNDFTPIYSWHERLELFVPLDGTVSMLMGERQVDIGAGELLIVENMKLHRILDIAGLDTRVVVISFMSNLVYSLGSPSHDYFFLLPFYTNVGNRLHIVRDALLLADIHQIVSRLLRCYFERTTYFQIGCKAYFLELLYILAEFFRAADFRYSELIHQQERSAKLKPVLEFVDQHFAERITLKQAAALARMSVPQFIKLFKRVAGMSFVSYLTHVRLSRSVRLLKESCLTIAEVAYRVGFSDQSYFDRRFKAAFGQIPRDFRLLHKAPCRTSNGSRPTISASIRHQPIGDLGNGSLRKFENLIKKDERHRWRAAFQL